MFEPFAIIFNQRIPTMTVALILTTLFSLAWILWQSPSHQRGRVLDVCLGAIVVGIVIGRLAHVTIHWEFFSERTQLIGRLSQEGGLTWQAFTISALIAGSLLAHWRDVSFAWLLKTIAILVPLIALGSWYACATVACAYGESVQRMADYPAWLTWIAPDIYRLEMPRFATQALGMASSVILLIVALILHLTNWLEKTRFWLMLIAIALTSFSIGFLRGDATWIVADLRIGQILDIVVIVFSMIAIVVSVWLRKQ
ncbi:MAG: prolipoprotein diacylglyceryl transferase family protein [Chloroflexota bacterium]